MNPKSLEKLSIFELASLYQKVVNTYGDAIDNGDSKTANKQTRPIGRIEKEFGRRQEEGHAAILNLMTNSSPWVRLLSASYAFRFAPQQAELVVQELASGPGFCGFTAEITLKEWRKGTLNLID